MNRVLAILSIMTSVALGSCVNTGAGPNSFAWVFQDLPGEGPKLAYGAPASDNVVLMMTCEPGAERVNVSLLGGSPQGGLILTSGGAKAALDGEAMAWPGAGHMIEAETPLTAAPLARFERTGDLTLVDRGRSVKLNADAAERRDVSRFFEACRV